MPKIRLRFGAGDAPVEVKRRVMNSIALKMSLYMVE
jgi:hypothetical protein